MQSFDLPQFSFSAWKRKCVHEPVFKAVEVALDNFFNFVADLPIILEQFLYLIASSIPEFSFLGLVNYTSLE